MLLAERRDAEGSGCLTPARPSASVPTAVRAARLRFSVSSLVGQRNRILVAASLGFFVIVLDTTIVNLALPRSATTWRRP